MRQVRVDIEAQRRQNRLAELLDNVVHAGEVTDFEGWILSPAVEHGFGPGVIVMHRHEQWISFPLTRSQAWDMLV